MCSTNGTSSTNSLSGSERNGCQNRNRCRFNSTHKDLHSAGSHRGGPSDCSGSNFFHRRQENHKARETVSPLLRMKNGTAIYRKQIGGQVALFDSSDAAFVDSLTLHLQPKRDGRFYVVNGQCVAVHRLLLNPPPGMVVDHISGDPLDNRRCNLRICTPQQNLMNRRRYKPAASVYKGINVNKGRICCQIASTYQGKSRTTYLGVYESHEAAARAYDYAASYLFGEFACLNFPLEKPSLAAVRPQHRFKFGSLLKLAA